MDETDYQEMRNTLNAAIEEIRYSLISNKSQQVKEFYQENAIRYIERVVLMIPTIEQEDQ